MKRSQRMPFREILDLHLPSAVSVRLPLFVQRGLRVGPRYGIAHGFVVYGANGRSDGEIDAESPFLQPHDLLQWLADRGERIDNPDEALAAIERRLPEAIADEELGHMLSGEIGLLLGNALVANADGAQWKVWQNGHPVVQVGRTDLDATAIADRYVEHHGESPTHVVNRYRSSAGG
ncbi:hypothetical protein IEU95_10630 [Hoyosella rhizosphaerae]|uniref:DUF6278 family protein n=1 Tax=Hoyosella rhizosphaerae TaxID=1755582 RepID=UPI00166BBDCC|nr:DUF6278 family protein [Hoyosella rhizosphaerae]MBN4927290.1 hypothetical protein [Hoyosella rhizosphaerae]